jgi:hypothetical protein
MLSTSDYLSGPALAPRDFDAPTILARDALAAVYDTGGSVVPPAGSGGAGRRASRWL